MAAAQSTSKRPMLPESSEDNTGPGPGPRKRRKTNNRATVDSLQAGAVAVPAHFVNISDELKSRTLRHMLDKIITDPCSVSGGALVTLACEHGIKRQKRPLLMSALQSHHCTWACLIHYADAQEAGQLTLTNQDILLPPFDWHLVSLARDPAMLQKVVRKNTSRHHLLGLEADEVECAILWPRVESEEFLNEIMRENRT
ncbi:hypothetical protein B0H10DRAFT_2215313 [Mycena sp. CBHHK59/15]|nr:hypothetical protein B0H10DRAFT_2215313 [Mycena sp. CBHHK59/15]